MKKTKIFSPYSKDGKKTNLLNFTKKSGVYFIYKKSKLVYIGYSSADLYKTILRHFQTWNDKQQQRFVYNRLECKIRVVLTTPLKAAKLEEALILKHRPKDNKLKLELINERQREAIIKDFTNASNIPF